MTSVRLYQGVQKEERDGPSIWEGGGERKAGIKIDIDGEKERQTGREAEKDKAGKVWHKGASM